jgi:hypothetical protein
MKDTTEAAARKAESWQSAKALLIPVCLFLACVVSAAGTFLVYNHEALGWFFLAISGTTIIACFIGLIRFQNTYRARGVFTDDDKPEQGDQFGEVDKSECSIHDRE